MSTVKQQYNQFKVEYDSLQKILSEEKIRQANIQSALTRATLGLQFEKQGVTREPTWFMVGGQS
ncbi:MAG: hypothetical protein KJ077_13730 [Anaerolineae bacterium]|nr:hypothetical protein [Anaerolineae bacterium]